MGNFVVDFNGEIKQGYELTADGAEYNLLSDNIFGEFNRTASINGIPLKGSMSLRELNGVPEQLNMHAIQLGKIVDMCRASKSNFMVTAEKFKEAVISNNPQFILDNFDARYITDEVLDEMFARKMRITNTAGAYEKKCIVLEVSSNNYYGGSYGRVRLIDGSEPNWASFEGKYKFFKAFPDICTYVKSDTDNGDYVDIYPLEEIARS